MKARRHLDCGDIFAQFKIGYQFALRRPIAIPILPTFDPIV
jgi:hypothetical protein